MRRHLHLPALIVALAVALVSARAEARIRFKWDCYLPGANVDCAVIESSLVSKVPFLSSTTSDKDANVVITLTSVPTEDGTRFVFDFEGKPVEGYVTAVHSSDKIPSTVGASAALVRIMTQLERGLGEFMDQKIASEAKDGKLDIQLMDPTTTPYQGRRQPSVRWYFAPSVSTYLSDVVGVGINAWGSAAMSFNYSLARWRVQQSIGASYNRQSQPVPGTDQTATVDFAGAWTTDVVSRDLTRDHRWIAGLLFGAEKNPQANYDFRANASLGLEFDLVPRQTVNQQNLGMRCAVGPELHHYDALNVEGLSRQLVAREFCDLFVSWHFEPVDVSASLGENMVLKDIQYRSFSGAVSATFRLTDSFLISPWVSVQQINQAINEAQSDNTVYTDPKAEIEASMKAAIQRGYTAPFGLQSGLSLKYVFGNGSLSSEDQRWRGVSSLR